ncbi:serine kinase [Dyella sp.]|uniref:serine kinase n=1 Tax=Dyella sp. TaxID=1869338 RepID=UPI003217CCB4
MTNLGLAARPAPVDDAAIDPFGERTARRFAVNACVLGADVRFEADDEAWLEVIEAAYGSLPAHRFPAAAPALHIELRLAEPADAASLDAPPPVHMRSGAGLLCGVMDAAHYAAIAPARRQALVVASPAMLARHPYHVRYELLEFAVFVLAQRAQGLVPLHGACVGRDGQGVLLLGESGAGKSTLALHSLLGGLDFLAEDAVFVHPDYLRATGVANYLHVTDDAFRFVDDAGVRDWIRRSPTIRRRSGVEKYEVDLRGGHGRLAPEPLQLKGVVLVSARPAERLLTPLPPNEAIARLAADQPYAAGLPGWDEFCRRCVRLGVYRLARARHPGEAVAALSAWLER